LALVFVLSAVSAAAAGPEIAPRYRFKEGDKLAYVVEATTRIETIGFGRTNTAVMSQLIDLTWVVERVDAAGKATITQTIERIQLKARTPDSTMTHDTKSPPPPALSETTDPRQREAIAARQRIVERLNGVVGARLSATIDAQGRIADIRLVERAGGGGTAASDWGGLGNPASEAGFRRLMGQLIPLLSEGAPARGDSWSSKGEEKVPGGKTITETRYTSDGEEERGGRQLQKVSLAVVRANVNESGEAVGTTNGGGAAYLDTAAGHLMESSLTHTRVQQIDGPEMKVIRKVTETITLKLAE